MHLITKLERALGDERKRPELHLHGTIPWGEEATPDLLLKAPDRLIDVDAGSFGVGGLPFRTVATLDLLAPDEIEDDLLSSVLNERREALLQSPGSWCGGDRVWVRFVRDKGPTDPRPGGYAPPGITDENILDDLIRSARARLLLRRKWTQLRVHKIDVTDFRGIKHLALDLSPTQTTVLVGANGSGKTTLLTAAGLLLKPLAASLRRSPLELLRNSLLRDDDLRNGRDFTRLEITATVGDETVSWAIGRSRGRDSAADVRRPELDAAMDRLGDVVHAYGPVIVHYSVNRAVHGISLKDNVSEEALPEGTTDFRRFFEWFREREDLENETRIHDSAHRDPQLRAIRSAIPPLIPGFENLRVQRAPLRMVVNKGEWTLYVDQLSDGEKCLLAMAGDLARRLAMANPYADDPLLGGGVVLIDEIELHLHPGWQRRVVPALESTFPNCQFILTTHSPVVLGHVDRDSVFILKPEAEGIQVLHPDASKGSDVSRIIEDVLDAPARSDDFMKQIDRLYKLLDGGDTASARALHTELTATLGALDPALVKAEVLLRRREPARR